MSETTHNYDYDVIVIGCGPGGAEAARELGKHGKKVAVIEGDKIGGTCLNRGCIPAKTMLYMAEMYRKIEHMEEYGVIIDKTSVKTDFPMMVEKRKQIIEKLGKGLAFQLKQCSVELIEAHANLTDAHTVELSTGSHITADKIILATGGKARLFPGFKSEDKRYLTSDNIFELTQLPKSMTIIGSGPVGLEFASFFRTFGADIHIVEMADNFLHYYDEGIGKEIVKAFKRDKMNCHLNTTIHSIDDSGELLKITLESGESFETEYILSAIGVEITADYIKASEIERTKGNRVAVNENFQTLLPNVYALGDLIGKSGSAYGAEREAKNIALQILGEDPNKAPVEYVMMPDVIFTHPEAATCGYSAKELAEKGIEYDTKSVQFMVNSKATIKNETRGLIWVYVEKSTQKILGVHIVGPQATEIIHMVPTMVRNHMTVDEYLKMVWGHPVLSEIMKEVLTLG